MSMIVMHCCLQPTTIYLLHNGAILRRIPYCFALYDNNTLLRPQWLDHGVLCTMVSKRRR